MKKEVLFIKNMIGENMIDIPDYAYTDKCWLCVSGRWVPIKDMDDKYLANTLKFVNYYLSKCLLNLGEKYINFIRNEMLIEATNRNLSKEFLEAAPYPYQDGNGNWMVWSFEQNKDIPYKENK